MEDGDNFIKTYKKFIEPVVAVGVVILLVFILLSLIEDNKLKKEIGKNCGYENKDYVCYCEKNFIENKRIEIENSQKENGGFGFNASLDG